VPKDYTVQVYNTVNTDFRIDLLVCPQSVLCCDLLRCANPAYQESCRMSYTLQGTGSSATPVTRAVEENRLSKYRCMCWLSAVLVGGNVASNCWGGDTGCVTHCRPLNRRLGGPQSRCGRCREEIILVPLLGFETSFLRRPVRWLGEGLGGY
jgi:hypothetical protein